MAHLEIRLFGAPQFTLDGAPWAFGAPPRALALLGALVANGDEFVSRERLAAALWPADSETDGRSNLRRHLHRVVRALPAIDGVVWIENTAAGLRWNPSAPAWIDVREFERMLASGAAAELLPAYRGEYLEAHFDDWVVAERERLRGRYAEAIAECMEGAHAAKDYALAAACAERLLGLDEWREDAIRSLMSARHGAGERAAALALYDRFARRLQEEFHAEPAAETRALRDAIRANVALALATTDSEDEWIPPREILAPLSFAGRAVEIDRLRGLWGRAARGNGSTVFVGGEAGIGKSRLTRELAAIVDAEGGRVLIGATSTPEAAPYQAILVALRAGLPWFARPELGDAWIAALAGVLPEMHGLLADGAPPNALAPEPAQQRLFEAIARAVEAAGRTKPLLLVLEDVHVAGEASLDLIATLSRRLASTRVLLLATHRTGESQGPAAIERVARDLRQERRAVSIALAPLAENDLSEIVARTETLNGVPPEFLPRVAALSSGNPLFAAQLLYGYVEGHAAPASEPHTVGEAISTRLERLDASVRAIALVAAAIGETFRTDLVAEVGGWSENAVLAAVGALVERRMVREAGAASLEYAFTHALIRQTLYDSIPDAERSARHRRLAAVMSRSEAGDHSDAALARHWAIAGNRENARAAYERAAIGALDVHARAEAAGYARAALDLADDDETRLRLLALLVGALERLPDLDAFRRESDAFVELARRCDDLPRQSESLKTRQAHQLRSGDREGQRRTIDAMTEVAARSGLAEHRIAALVALGNLEHVLGHLNEADATYREALSLALRAGERDVVASVRSNVMSNALLLGNLDDVESLLAQQRTLLAQSGPDERIGVVATAAWLAHVREDFDELVLQARELLQLAEAIGDTRREARAHLWMAYADHQELRGAEARAHYHRCRELSRSIGNLGEQTTVAANLGGIDVETGHAAAALLHLREALELARRIDTKTLEGHVLGTQARALTQLGKYAEALPVAREALHLALETREKGLIAKALVNLGEAEIASGSVDEGIAHVREGAAARRELAANDTLLEDLAILVEGLLAARCADAAAESAAEMAAIAAARRVLPTRACFALARAAQARDDRAGAFKWSQRGKASLAEYLSRMDSADRETFSALPWNVGLAEWA